MTIPNKENRDSYYILIGKDKHGQYVILEEAFEHSDNFKGLTGIEMEFHTEDEFEEEKRNYVDSGDMKYLWKEAVASDSTEQGYDDRVSDVLYYGADNLVYDSSYRCSWRMDDVLKVIDEHEYEETGIHVTDEYSDCVGGGRIFKDEMLDKDYRERIDEENFEIFKKLYKKYEM